MKINRLATLFMALLCITITSVTAFAMDVKGKHAGKVSCVDCHGSDSPDKAASKSACLKCHENLPKKELTVEHEGRHIVINPHKGPHDAGETLRCALCHSAHNQPKLQCNSCHHFEGIKVP